MTDTNLKKSDMVGLQPGALVHIGENKVENVKDKLIRL